jgi:hypothetical protein
MVYNKFVSNKLWKTCFLQFQTKNSKMLDIQLNYLNNQIPSILFIYSTMFILYVMYYFDMFYILPIFTVDPWNVK